MVKTHQWNRQPHAIRELGGSATIVAEIIHSILKRTKETAQITREWFKTPHSAQAKKYVEEHPNEFPYAPLKINKRTD